MSASPSRPPARWWRPSLALLGGVLNRLLLPLFLLLTSCGTQRELSIDECELTVWFIEDIAHAQARRPEELQLATPSTAMKRLASWLCGGTEGRYQSGGQRAPETYHPPGPLAARANRWPSLHALFLAHQVVVLPSGLVAARPGLSTDDEAAALQLVDPENLDRRALEALVAGMCAPGSLSQRTWLSRAVQARTQLDQQGGAEIWQPHAQAAAEARSP